MPISSLGAAHVAAALVALAFGLFVIAVPKGTQFHRAMGMAYAVAMVVLNVASLGIFRLTGHFGPFHALALLSLAVVMGGVSVVVRRPPNWLHRHYTWMSFSYLGLLSATVTEMAIRVPDLALNSPLRGMMVGVGSAVAFTVMGAIILPRMERRALAALSAE
jgi:uncharacterized membrane protein